MAHILVVDDDAIYLNLLANTLSNKNYNVFIAKDGVEALKLCESQEFDLIITDILMPNVDGIDFIMKFNKCNSNTPVIAISAGSNRISAELNLKTATALGVYSILLKPFSSEKFIDTVRSALAHESTVDVKKQEIGGVL
jgi:DNA-binding NtrC family response regulator